MADLPDFPFASRSCEWQGLRLAYLDEGDHAAPPVLGSSNEAIRAWLSE